jgi:hypothetical protein
MKFRSFVTLLSVFALVSIAFAQGGIDGKWEAKQTTQRGEVTITFEFKNAGGNVTGTVTQGQGGATEIKNGKLAGSNLTFETTQPGRGGAEPTTLKWSGTVSGDTLKLKREGGRGAAEMDAKRVK